MSVRVVEWSELYVERSIWMKVKEVERLGGTLHAERFLLVLSLTKERRFWLCLVGDEIDQRLLLPKPKKHGKQKLRTCNTSPSNLRDLCSLNTLPSNRGDIFQSPHNRACKCWQDIHLAENMRHYGEHSHLLQNVQQRHGVRPRDSKHSNLFVASPLASLPQGPTWPDYER